MTTIKIFILCFRCPLLGEFSLVSNPRILQPMRDILIDEKSLARFQLTHSQAYEEGDIQRPRNPAVRNLVPTVN